MFQFYNKLYNNYYISEKTSTSTNYDERKPILPPQPQKRGGSYTYFKTFCFFLKNYIYIFI